MEKKTVGRWQEVKSFVAVTKPESLPNQQNRNFPTSRLDGRSFKDVAIGNKIKENEKKNVVCAVIHEGFYDRLQACSVGRARNIYLLRNVSRLLKEDGLGNCKIQYA